MVGSGGCQFRPQAPGRGEALQHGRPENPGLCCWLCVNCLLLDRPDVLLSLPFGQDAMLAEIAKMQGPEGGSAACLPSHGLLWLQTQHYFVLLSVLKKLRF